jgi:hypothetical protein
MPKPVKVPDLVSWSAHPAGGAERGIITQHVKQPYYLDLGPRGEWVVLTLDKHDKPKIVDKGQARNVTTAKQDATACALSKIPELKAAITTSTGELVDTKARVIEPPLVSGRRATLRVYGYTAALILWGIWLFYLWLRHQPLRATLSLLVLAFGVVGAHYTLKALDHLNARRERIVKRKQLQQAKQIAQQKAPQVRQVPQPTARRALAGRR